MTTITPFTSAERASHNSHKFAFTLSPTNYGYWKTVIETFLTTNNLVGYVNGQITCPPATETTTLDNTTATTTNPNYTAWITNDAHVRMIIISTISEASFAHVQGTTAQQLWNSLARAYAPHTASREFTLKTQLLKLQMKGDETPLAYLTRVQEYASSLANIGESVKDKDLVLYAISGLREEYNGLKSTLLARSTPMAFNELYGLLTDHDYMVSKPPQAPTAAAFIATAPPAQSSPQLHALQQIASQLGYQLTPNIHVATQPQAFYNTRPTHNRGNPNRGRRNPNPNRGNNYNNRGRGRNDTRSQFSWASAQNTVYGTCTRCGIGHIPSECPNRDPSTIRNHPNANYADSRSQPESSGSRTWHPDTGANSHVTPDFTGLDSSEPYHGNDSLHVGNGKGLPILHIGSSKFHSLHKSFSISNILHVPEIKKNLLSVQKFCLDNNVFFEFHSSYFVVKDKSTRNILLTGPSEHGLYSLRLPDLANHNKLAFSATRASSTVWHRRLGHPHHRLLQFIVSNCSIPVTKSDFTSCTACPMGKSTKLHLRNSNFRSSNYFDLLYCDVWGPAPVVSYDGHRYFMLCVDHHSRYMWIFPLANKSDVYQTFTNFVHMIERNFNTKVKQVQTDWGGEFRPLSNFFTSLGIIHRLSCPHTSEQNGFVERRHRHVVETGLTLLAQSAVPKRFWHFAFDTAVYLINRMPSRTSNNKSPFEYLFHKHPDYFFLRVFGCQCFPHLRPYNPHKMDFRSTSCIFLGYSPQHHGYRCLDPTTDRIYVARHVRFIEHNFPYQTSPNSPPTHTSNPYFSQSDFTTFPDDPPTPSTTPPSSPTNPSTPSPNHTLPTQSTSPPSPPPHRPRPTNLRQNPKPRIPYSPSVNTASTNTSYPVEPTSFTIANKSPEWRNAMLDEYRALLKNGTWTLVPYVPNTNVIDTKWLFRIKRNELGNITRYKARLVAKGFSQQSGVDFHETFSPVVKPTTIRVVLSTAVTKRWPLRQLDIQNAFLHGSLTETVYIKQPQGFVDQNNPDYVCLLHKSLYGLKQAPRAWFQRLSEALQQQGFQGSKTDPSLFTYNRGNTTIYTLVYVDDIIVTGNDPTAVNNFITSLSKTFAVKDLGSLHYFLGIELVPQGKNILLSQRKYITDILNRHAFTDCKPAPTPMCTSHQLSIGDSPLLPDQVKYRQLVGALQYVTLSRPDIAFAVNKVCQYMHAPTENHWAAAKRILRYLKGTIDQGLLFCHNSGSHLQAFTDAHWQCDPNLTAFSDADWAGCPDDRRSTGGFAIYMGSNLISWIARKQKTVSRSSTESEYKALADTVAELTWLQALLKELGIHTASTPTLWCDNLGATYLSKNPVFHARTKHVEVDFHFVREKVAEGKLQVQFISTEDQIADIFTKPLSTHRFTFLRSKLKVVTRL